MPPRLFSRHSFTTASQDREGSMYLSRRTRFGFRSLPDNIFYTVRSGDTLQNIAGRFYAPMSQTAGLDFSPSQLWWIIADYQPTPIHDPTVVLSVGSVVIVPSLRTVRERIFNPAERPPV